MLFVWSDIFSFRKSKHLLPQDVPFYWRVESHKLYEVTCKVWNRYLGENASSLWILTGSIWNMKYMFLAMYKGINWVSSNFTLRKYLGISRLASCSIWMSDIDDVSRMQWLYAYVPYVCIICAEWSSNPKTVIKDLSPLVLLLLL